MYAETLNDNVYEGNETITIGAGVPGRQQLVTSDSATISDEADKPKVTSVSDASVDEGGMATLTVSLSNESTAPTRVFIDAYGSGGTATEGADFNTKDIWVNYGSGWVKASGDFAAGNWIDVPANTQTFQIRSQTTQDDVYEGSETYLIKAKADGQSDLISGTVTINDQADLPMIDSITHLRDGVEGGAWPGWTVNMTNTSTTNTTVQLNFNDGLHQADFGNDYSGKVHVYSTSGTFLEEVVLNASNGWRANVNVPAGEQGIRVYAETLNDNVYEGDESIQIQAGIPGRQSLIESEEAAITDEADKPRVTSVSNTSTNEGDAASVTITLSNESTSTTRVFVDAYGGSATEGADFNTKDLWVNYGNGWVKASGDFSAGNWIDVPANTKTFQVRSQTTEDGTYEGNESYTIKAKADGQSNLVSGTVTIVDDEAATIVESVTQLRDGVEGGTAPGWTVNFNNPSDEATTVRLNFNDGYHQADLGTDYSGKVFIYNLAGQKVGEEVISSANNYRVDISVPAGQNGVRVYAQTLNDNVYEGNETITIGAGVPGRQQLVTSDSATISDEADTPKVASISHLQNATEDAWVGWTVNMTNTSTTNSTVQLNFNDGLHQADFGADYNGKVHVYTTSGTFLQEVVLNASNGYKANINIPAGHSGVKIYADTLNDNVFEGNESIKIQGAVIGQQGWVQSQAATITDEADTPKVASISHLQNATEDAWVGWTVNMTNTSTTNSTVQLNFNDGLHQADFGADYNGKVHVYTTSGTFLQEVVLNASNGYKANINIPAGHSGVKIYADTLNDNVFEGNESIKIQGAVIGQQGWVQSQAATITDEADTPKVASVSNTSTNEGDAASVTITLSNESTSTTRVFVDAYGGSATEGADFNTKDLWVNYGNGWVKASGDFSAGNWIDVPANTKTFQVRSQTTEDGTYEGNESYTIKAKADGQSNLVSGTVTIVDDEAATIVESVTQLRDGVEGGTAPGWTVNFNNPSDEATTVRLNFNDGYHQADLGTDYSGKVFIYNLAGQKVGEEVISSTNNYRVDISVPAGQNGVRVYAQTLNDNVYEGNETITIGAGVPGRQQLVTSDSATISDEADTPKVASISHLQNATEDAWVGWTVNMTNTSTTNSTVQLNFNDGLHQADFGTDYNGKVHVYTTSGTFLKEVVLNASNGYKANINIPAGHSGVKIYADTLNDNVFEGNESIKIQGAVIGQQGWVQSQKAVITDEADSPEVNSISKLNDAMEGNRVGWQVNMSNTSTSDTTVQLNFNDGYHQADFGNDYSGKVFVYTKAGTFLQEVTLNGSNSWRANIKVPAGHSGVKIYAETIDNDVYEGSETIQIQGAVIGKQGWVQSQQATITDEADSPKVSSISHLQNANEDGWVGWTVNMTNTSTTNSTVQLNFNDGLHQADFGADYNGKVHVYTTSGTFLQEVVLNASNGYKANINIPAGHSGVKIYADTLNDNVFEGNESIKIQGAVIGKQGWVQSQAATITDEADTPKVASISHLNNATEDAWVGWTVNMTNTSTTNSTVQLNFNDGLHQADFGADYNGKVHVYTTSGTFLQEVVLNASNGYKANINIPAGHSGVKIYADTLNDNVFEGNESIKIQGAVIGKQGWIQSAQATILDDADKPTLSVVNTNTGNKVNESNWATFNIKLSNPVDQVTKVKVNVFTGAEPGITNKDLGGYEYWTGSAWANFKSGSKLTIAAFQTELQIRVKPVDDNKADGNETLIIKAKPIGEETHIHSGEVQGSVLVVDKGYQDTSNSNSGHVHWHIDGGGAQHLVGNGWRPNEKVTLFGPDGSKTVVYADNFGNFHLSGDNLYTATGTLTARGRESGDSTDYITPNITPIVLDLDGDGIETSDVTEAPVSFDYDGDGEKINTGWASGGDGLLVHDINKDGQINDGSELFGSNTLLQDGTTAADGYEALAQHDANADGVIDENDAVYADLNVWVDKDQDGEADEGELLSMEDAGVASINLDAQTTDDEQNNNIIGKTSTYTTTDGEERTAADVWFATQQNAEEETNLTGLIEEHNISGLDSSELVWHSEDVADHPWSDTVTDFNVEQTHLDLSDLVHDKEDHLLTESDVDMFEQDGSLVLRVDTDGDHTWNQEIILQDVSLQDIVDENGVIKNGVFSDDNVKELFQKAAATDVVENTSTHLDDPTIDHH
ncbi:type I secretion C-terminal target domain-containing protein [Enterovibrio sp. Hal110]